MDIMDADPSVVGQNAGLKVVWKYTKIFCYIIR